MLPLNEKEKRIFMKNTLILIVLAVLLISCEETEKYEKITGEWECISWMNQSTGQDKCDDEIYFKFERDKTYYSKLGAGMDTGRYKIIDETLFVTPEGKQEFSVIITELTMDTLVFLMNSAGEREILTLTKMNKRTE